MPDRPGLDRSRGMRLSLAAYRREFRERQWEISDQESWKLERRQHFAEPGFESWEAFHRGSWDEALRLIEAEREYLREFSAEAARRNIGLYRVRVVERPIDPYLQWELHLLRLREECGEMIRVVGPEAVRPVEARSLLPELVTLGSRTLYEVLYNADGALDGAIRYTDAAIVDRWTAFIRDLFEKGEELNTYFSREIAGLPPPAGDATHPQRAARG
jgi:hypothetical protein